MIVSWLTRVGRLSLGWLLGFAKFWYRFIICHHCPFGRKKIRSARLTGEPRRRRLGCRRIAADGRRTVEIALDVLQAAVLPRCPSRTVAEQDAELGQSLYVVYDGYPSIGCATCTIRVEPGADPRSGRWAGTGKTECGIHA